MSHTFATMEERNDIVIYQSEDGLCDDGGHG